MRPQPEVDQAILTLGIAQREFSDARLSQLPIATMIDILNWASGKPSKFGALIDLLRRSASARKTNCRPSRARRSGGFRPGEFEGITRATCAVFFLFQPRRLSG